MELRRILLAMVAAGMAGTAASAAEAGSIEASAGVGSVFNGGIHPSVAAGAGLATTSHILLGLEFCHIPLSGAALRGPVLEPSRFPRSDSRAEDLNGYWRVTIPVGQERARPYVAAGIGMLRWSFQAAGTRYSGVDFAANFGAGVKWHIGERWGLRPEVKVYVPDRTFVRLGVSLFYQTR